MKIPTRKSLVLAVTASLAACVAHDGQVTQPVPVTTTQPLADLPVEVEIPEITPMPEPSPVEARREREQLKSSQAATKSVLGKIAAPNAADAFIASGAVANEMVCCASPPPHAAPEAAPENTEKYQHLSDNPVRLTSEQPVSTFSIDVDTGSYANVRRYLNAGQLPPQDAARVEEMINYFDYQYEAPRSRTTPFNVHTEVALAPWNKNALLMKIGIKGYELAASERPAANLVFLVDVSGSMESADKLPLLKNAFKLLTDQLTAKDRVSIVVYAGSAGMVLAPTAGDQKYKIRAALDRLQAGGSTNGAQGIQLAYQLAHDTYIRDGINRVVLATDGDFNVGMTNFESVVDLAERERKTGVALTTLGFGTGNYNDQLMERLADAGNGNYSYIDTLSEARKVLVSELSATLITIAKDVKIQVEFNPALIQEYRLIGYENRLLNREDFNNDQIDAGEIGAGHRVTALYELIPVGSAGLIDAARYAPVVSKSSKSAASTDELAYVRLRYKRPDNAHSELLNYPINKASVVRELSTDLSFAASVAAFGQQLRGSKYMNDFGYADIVKLAQQGMGADPDGYRHEFVSLVKLAQSLDNRAAAINLPRQSIE
jgi:Ca-activated chloride channel family protein